MEWTHPICRCVGWFGLGSWFLVLLVMFLLLGYFELDLFLSKNMGWSVDCTLYSVHEHFLDLWDCFLAVFSFA